MEYFVENEVINKQINKIKKLFLAGFSDSEIANQFESEKEVNLISRSISWSAKDIEMIRNNFEINNPYQSGFNSISSLDNAVRKAPENTESAAIDESAEILTVPIAQKNNKRFLKKIIDGDFSLSKTFWLFGVLPGVSVSAIGLGIIYIYDVYNRFEYDNKLFFFWISLFLAYTVYSLFILIGVWKAAKKQGSMMSGAVEIIVTTCAVIYFVFFSGAIFSNNNLKSISSSTNVHWFAKMGDPDAQYKLGDMYSTCDDRRCDWNLLNAQEAVKWYRLAAEQGHVLAQVSLGNMYFSGNIRDSRTHHYQDVLPDYQEAAKWYRLAAENGNAWAQSSLGLMYALGIGVPKKEQESAKWLRLAAEHGDFRSQVLLGQILSDSVESYAWLKLAAILDAEQGGSMNGHKLFSDEDGRTIKEQADIIYAELTASQAQEAQLLLNQLYNRISKKNSNAKRVSLFLNRQ